MQSATPAERKAILRDAFGDNAEGKLQSFSAYFNLYDSLTSSQYAAVQIHPPALRSHDAIRKAILELRANPQITRKEFKDLVFAAIPADSLTTADKDHAINVVVHLMLMVDCADKHRRGEGYEVGDFRPAYWGDGESFADFIKKVFLKNFQDDEAVRAAIKQKNALKGWKLQKRAHVKFLPTNNLAEHLLYDERDNVVHIFHQTAFLKAHLRLSVDLPIDCDIADCLKRGTLPPQLLLETLHSVQFILFPSVDEKSSRLLESLVRDASSGFDPDNLLYEGHIRRLPENFEYHYWGSRIAKLHHVARNPRSSHHIARWIQRHASERNALIIALLSLVLTTFFGFLSVLIGIFQSWVAYQSWKNPSGGTSST